MLQKLRKKFEKKIVDYIHRFEEETTNRRKIYYFLFGFFGVGELKIPHDHVQKGVNKIIAHCYNINNSETDIVEQFRFECTKDELERMSEAINDFLAIMKD